LYCNFHVPFVSCTEACFLKIPSFLTRSSALKMCIFPFCSTVQLCSSSVVDSSALVHCPSNPSTQFLSRLMNGFHHLPWVGRNYIPLQQSAAVTLLSPRSFLCDSSLIRVSTSFHLTRLSNSTPMPFDNIINSSTIWLPLNF